MTAVSSALIERRYNDSGYAGAGRRATGQTAGSHTHPTIKTYALPQVSQSNDGGGSQPPNDGGSASRPRQRRGEWHSPWADAARTYTEPGFSPASAALKGGATLKLGHYRCSG